MAEETTIPSVDELEAKRTRLVNEVDEAKAALEVAKQTFADAAQSDPTAVESLLELATAVKAAESTVSKSENAVRSNDATIAGIEYDAKMSGITEAGTALISEAKPVYAAWCDENADALDEANVEIITAVYNRVDGTMSVKPSGADMPKRPSAARGSGNGTRGPRGTRTVTTADGTVLSCRDYVRQCGDQASPAAQADLAGEWDGSPVSYTNEAKRLAGKNNDTFA